MTKERYEQLSNRIVINFGFLLGGALILLYIYNAIKSVYQNTVYNIVLVCGILSFIAMVLFFIIGLKKKPKLKNYSGVFLGMFIVSAFIYSARYVGFYDGAKAVIITYIAMLVYFIVLSVVIALMLRKPIITEKKEILHRKKKNK